MDALDFYRSMVFVDNTQEEILRKLKAADSSSDEPQISLTYAEAEHVYDVCYEFKRLMEIMMGNTQIENTEAKVKISALPFYKLKENENGCGITKTN